MLLGLLELTCRLATAIPADVLYNRAFKLINPPSILKSSSWWGRFSHQEVEVLFNEVDGASFFVNFTD